MKMFPVLAAALLVAACAQTAPGTQSAPGQAVGVTGAVPMAYVPGTPAGTYAAVPAQATYTTGGQQVVISGDLQTSRVPTITNTAPRHDLVVRVNGQPAVSGTLATYGTTTLEGQAGSMPVSTTCMSRELGPADRQFDCRVSLNGRPASILSFRATPVGPQQPMAPMMTLTAG